MVTYDSGNTYTYYINTSPNFTVPATYSITGTLAVGETLTVEQSSNDHDGIQENSTEYVWESSSDGNTWTPNR